MPATAATPHAAKPSRFFALTAERLEAITRHRLTRADIQVWAFVELNACPRQPAPFTLEGIAERLQLGVDTVRRAVRRLMQAGLLAGFFQGNRYRLAPASSPFESGNENPEFLPGSTRANKGDKAGENLARSRGKAGENLDSLQGGIGQNAGQKPVSGTPQRALRAKRKKESFVACALSEELSSQWGMYPAVAARLVATFGEARVRQVLEWAAFLKRAGKLKSRGWVYQALMGQWQAPDGFHAERHKPQEGASSNAQGVREPLPEDRERIVRWHLSRTDAALREKGRQLAALWGVDLEAAR